MQKRLGHADIKGIRQMNRVGAIKGLSITPGKRIEHICADFIKGKHVRLSIHDKAHRAIQVVHVIHSDVCRPISTASLGGSLYIVSYVDEYNGYAAVYPIAKKSDVLSTFSPSLPWF